MSQKRAIFDGVANAQRAAEFADDAADDADLFDRNHDLTVGPADRLIGPDIGGDRQGRIGREFVEHPVQRVTHAFKGGRVHDREQFLELAISGIG